MYLLIACAGSWLVLLGSLCTAWTQLPQPRTTSDLVVITIIGAATLVFSRLGLVSLFALLLRVLPSGRIRSALAGCILRFMPRLLASSVLAAVSAGLVVQGAQAAPAGDDAAVIAHSSDSNSAVVAPADPGWPTVDGESPTTGGEETGAGSATDDELHDPAWPTEPPDEAVTNSPVAEPPEEDVAEPAETPSEPAAPPQPEPRAPADDAQDSAGPADPDSRPDSAAPSTTVHVVEPGESLWSIAAELVDSPKDTPQLVNDVYAANREIIGADPSLIIAGQRLEIQP